jgi:glycine/D-amino acid oxidase-like deaminating enzyme
MDANRRERESQVLVVGAGLIGATIAHQLATRGQRVAVVDAQKAADGATKRALGLATPHLSPEHVADTVRGVDALSALAMQLRVPARAVRVLHLASKPADTDALREVYQTLRGGRPRLIWESRPDAIPAGYSGGIVAHNSILLDIPALVVQLLQHPRITLRENAEVQALEGQGGVLTALAQGYTVRARAIVLATNAYAGLLSPYLADAVQVVRGAVWTSRPLNREAVIMERVLRAVPMPLLIDRTHLSVAQTLDSRLRINAWHWDHQTDYDPGQDIQRFLRAQLPELLDYTEAWQTGVMTVTRDSAPLVGKLAGNGTVLYALGAGMYGPAWAPIIAERIAQMLGVGVGG